MTLSPLADTQKLIIHCRTHLDFENITPSDQYGYSSLPLCVIDAVFSIGVRYDATRKVVERFCTFCDIPALDLATRANPASQFTIDDLLACYAQQGIEKMTQNVYQNRQRTSTQNGILKTEAVLRFSQALKQFDVNTLQDVPKILGQKEFEAAIQTIPGQRSGISLRYFYMLAGSDDFIKPDRMIDRFINDALKRSFNPQETTAVLREVCHHLKTDYPNLTPRSLDQLIWSHQRAQK